MEQIYGELNGKMGLGQSKYLGEVWKILCSDDEARMANLLPGSIEEIAEKSKENIDDTRNILTSLFKKGAIFKQTRDGKTTYKLAKNVVQFHDASLLWEGATQEYFELWKKVMDDEFTGFIKQLPEDFPLPSFMRVIPVEETIEPESRTLSYEECESIINDSEKVAVVKCPCRLSQQKCDAPVEACIQVNRGAEYVLDRGHGRELTKDEAMDIIRKSEDAGLVHMLENRSTGNVICNCCSCCCEMFRLARHSGKKWIAAPSRFLAIVNEQCTSCEECIEICPMEAISLNDIAEIIDDECIGCGLCAKTCPMDAISLKEIRPEEHIPVKK